MSCAPSRPASPLLTLGLALCVFATTRGDDVKGQAKKTPPAGTEPAAAKGGAVRKTGKPEAGRPQVKAGTSATKPAASRPAQPGVGSPTKPVSFIRDVAPILVENCIACHNPRKSESKYVMTTFAQLAKGGQQGEGITLEPGKPDESNLIELIRPGGEPRMPYKQDPLPPEKIATLERWVAEGAKYDGNAPTEDWTILLRKTQAVSVPASYPVIGTVTG